MYARSWPERRHARPGGAGGVSARSNSSFIPLALQMRGLRLPTRFTLLAIAAVASGSYAGYALFELGVP
ncbi:hypothetical protein OG390_26965 [Streptomyces sp. NBC_00996]|nr:hypothetical protein OG390_26965 [Streptomyces sp. NBC_00996]